MLRTLVSAGLTGLALLAGVSPAFADTQFGAVPGMQTRRTSLVALSDAQGRIYVVGGDATDGAATMERFDPATRQWTTLAGPAVKRVGAGGAVVGGRLYVLGGEQAPQASNAYVANVDVFDFQTGAWTTDGQLQGPRSRVAVAATAGRIYVVGGDGAIYGGNPAPAHIPDPQSENFLDAHGVRYSEAFDPAAGASQVIKAVPRRRADAALVAGADGRLFAIGGWFEGDPFGYPDFSVSFGVTYVNDTVEAYSPATNSWTTVAHMRTPRSGLAAALGRDGRLWTFGGVDKGGNTTGVVEVLNPATGVWDQKAPMPTPRHGAAAAVGADGRFYVVGGTADRLGVTSLLEVYDPATDSWASSYVQQPQDSLDFASLAAQFDSPNATLPAPGELTGWYPGRCFEFDDQKHALGGLLVGYPAAGGVKVTAFEYTGDDPAYFDVLNADKRSGVQSAISSQDQYLQAAMPVQGHYLGSLVTWTNSAGESESLEYQVVRTPSAYLTRVVAVTQTSSLKPGATKAVCYHQLSAVH